MITTMERNIFNTLPNTCCYQPQTVNFSTMDFEHSEVSGFNSYENNYMSGRCSESSTKLKMENDYEFDHLLDDLYDLEQLSSYAEDPHRNVDTSSTLVNGSNNHGDFQTTNDSKFYSSKKVNNYNTPSSHYCSTPKITHVDQASTMVHRMADSYVHQDVRTMNQMPNQNSSDRGTQRCNEFVNRQEKCAVTMTVPVPQNNGYRNGYGHQQRPSVYNCQQSSCTNSEIERIPDTTVSFPDCIECRLLNSSPPCSATKYTNYCPESMNRLSPPVVFHHTDGNQTAASLIDPTKSNGWSSLSYQTSETGSYSLPSSTQPIPIPNSYYSSKSSSTVHSPVSSHYSSSWQSSPQQWSNSSTTHSLQLSTGPSNSPSHWRDCQLSPLSTQSLSPPEYSPLNKGHSYNVNYSLSSSSYQTSLGSGYNEMSINNKMNENIRSPDLEVTSSSPIRDIIQPSFSTYSQNQTSISLTKSTPTKRSPLTKKRKDRKLQLWEFILDLLTNPNNGSVEWIDQSHGLFRVTCQTSLVNQWSTYRNRGRMNFEKLTRTLRFYYPKGFLTKIQGKQNLYRYNYDRLPSLS